VENSHSSFAGDHVVVRGREGPLVILVYHELADTQSALATSPKLFAAHLKWLADRGYTSLSLGQFEEAASSGNFGTKRVLITFDDGYESVFRTGLPILREFGYSAVNFLITDKVGAPGHQSWDQVVAMQHGGVFSSQSHSHSHTRWSGIGEMIRDIATSRDILARRLAIAPDSVRHLAWPWGNVLPGWSEAAQAEGFEYQYLVRTSSVVPDTPVIGFPRVCCDRYSVERFAVTMRLLSNPLGARAMNLATHFWQKAKHNWTPQPA
jgi:peptidoglycan/xylan/chitin deacetylase (PgdA/CDA1 family)